MVRKVRKDIFVTALIITIGVFLLGIYIGKIWDDFRTNQIKSDLVESNLDILSILVSQEFLDSFNVDDCDVMDKRLSTMSYDLYKVGIKLNDYDKKKLLNEEEYNYLKTQYFLMELRAYTNFINFKKNCKSDQTIVLFFYDIGDIDSERQGYVLDSLVERDDVNIRVFSMDREHEETTLDMIKYFYEVEKSPTIIINNNIKKKGFVSIGELLDMIENENM